MRDFHQHIILLTHSEKKVVPATRNLRTNSASTTYHKVVITTMNK